MFSSRKRENSSSSIRPILELRTAVTRIQTILKITKSEYETVQSIKLSKVNDKSNNTEISENGTTSTTFPMKTKMYKFIPMNKTRESELVELIRRTAELVVRGERYAAMLQTSGSAGVDSESNDVNGDTSKKSKKTSEEELQSHSALFEYFCEKNVMGLFVNIVTGAAFSGPYYESICSNTKDTSSKEKKQDGKEKLEYVLLPPLAIATQGIQSLSILIQNVSRVTSLYFLLSNNRINELISFPLEHYSQASFEQHKQQSKENDKSLESIPSSSAEIAELATYFISFLKSLAMRMNAETLQFFLEYKSENPQSSDGHASGGDSLNGGSSSSGGDTIPKSNRHFSTSRKTNGDDVKKGQKVDDLLLELGVHFPLYARALQFCSNEQDSFVRVTAMNICLNTIRLATVVTSTPSSLDVVEEEKNYHESVINGNRGEQNKEQKETSSEELNSGDVKAPTPATMSRGSSSSSSDDEIEYNSPDANLVNVDLPTRERLAIAYHVCTPSRVQALVSPIFIQLTHLCGDLMESIRTLEKSESEHNRNHATYDAQRKKLTSSIKDIVADLQNELMLLDDILEVGLTSLNEQTVEMMLATFIYPTLLQPLIVHLQRHPFNGKDESFYHEMTINAEFTSQSNSINSQNNSNNDGQSTASSKIAEEAQTPTITKPLSRFPFKVVSNALVQSGLLGDTDNDTSDDEKESADSIPAEFFSDESFSQLIDSSSPKAAFIALISVLYTVQNRRVIYFVLTALFHPLAPNSFGGKMVMQKPNIISLPNNKIRIQVDPTAADFDAFDLQHMIDAFCKNSYDLDNKNHANEDLSQEECVFSLSPALAHVLDIGEDGKYAPLERKAKISGLRKNPYRRAVLACLSGTDGMVPLRKLAVCTVDAAVKALNGHGVETIFYGIGKRNGRRNSRRLGGKKEKSSVFGETDIFPPDNCLSKLTGKDPNDANDINIIATELISSLCSSILTASLCHHGFWTLEYNVAAAHALLGIIEKNRLAKEKTAGMIEFRRWQSSVYIAKLPSMVEMEYFQSPRNDDTGSASQNEYVLNLIMDRMFRDFCDENKKCVIDYMEFDRDQQTFWTEVSKTSRMDDSLSHVFNDIGIKKQLDDVNNEILLRNVAASARAYIQFDTFTSVASKGIDEIKESTTTRYDVSTKSISSLLHPQIGNALLDELPTTKTSSEAGNRSSRPGYIVTLVGRAAFPCVCEVSKESAALFKDAGSSVFASGVKWQSLYLVIVGRCMVLAEPEKSSGGNGRIVTSCPLSCISVQKDKQPPNATPARRLIITHTSLKEEPPGLFKLVSLRKKTAHRPEQKGNISVSRMDLWFEDKDAADAAFQTLSVKSGKARSKRGKHLRAAVQRDEVY